MKKILTYGIFILLIGFGIFLFSFSAVKNKSKKVHDVAIHFTSNDHSFLTKKMVNKLLIQNHGAIKNQPKSVIDLQGLEQRIVSNPYVEEAKVYLTIDGALRVGIKQRTPIARISSGNDVYYIDKQGIKIPVSQNYSSRVLLVNGVFDAKGLKEITSFINAIINDEFLNKEVVGVVKNAENEFELSARSGKHKIDFGNLDLIQVKFKKIKAFYKRTYRDKTIESYKRINVKYRNQIVCTK